MLCARGILTFDGIPSGVHKHLTRPLRPECQELKNMLKSLHLQNLGLVDELRVSWAERISLIVGDNGLGKTFLLDLAWWALTRTWASPIALPPTGRRDASIQYVVKGATGKTAEPVRSTYRPEEQAWPLKAARPTMPGIVIYVRVDGGFSVWDPARNYWRTDPGRPAAYHFQSNEVWDGLTLNGVRVCEGLERDWINWQEGNKPQFKVLEAVLKVLSAPGESFQVGTPQRIFLGEGRDRPTLRMINREIPVALVSSGVRRILALAYFLVWAWQEHQVAASLLGKDPEQRFVLLFDEPETHLHPRWQRAVLPSLLRAVDVLRGSGPQPQLIAATHAPLVAASLEPLFNPAQDDLIHLGLINSQVTVTQGHWAKQGDASNWLVSEAFGLEQARSIDAERAIEAAEAFMRGDASALPQGLHDQQSIHTALQRLLAAGDPFWPRWLLSA